MDPAVPRSIARLQYAAARLPFTLLGEQVVARYWDQDAPVRVGFERWLATVALEPGRSYRYRYLLDGQRWENDRQADRYVPNALGSIDSVVVVG